MVICIEHFRREQQSARLSKCKMPQPSLTFLADVKLTGDSFCRRRDRARCATPGLSCRSCLETFLLLLVLFTTVIRRALYRKRTKTCVCILEMAAFSGLLVLIRFVTHVNLAVSGAVAISLTAKLMTSGSVVNACTLRYCAQ